MQFKRLIFILLQLLPFENTVLSSQKIDDHENLILIKNEIAEIGILKNAGGRIVLYRRIGGENILKTDENLWDYKFEKPLEECVDMNIVPFNGHITWIGPQSSWWVNQNINKELRDNKSNWPPDPFLIYSKCEVIDQTATSITLVNPVSPFSGIKLTKKITLKDNGDVEIFSEIKNTRDTTIAADIWFNTRLDGKSKFFIPVKDNNNIRIDRSNNSSKVIMERIINGYYTFEYKNIEKIVEKVSAKAFIYPNRNKIFSFSNSELLTITFEHYLKDLVHPEQAVVEVYNRYKPNGSSLLELEYHSPYTKLEPNETLNSTEYWSLTLYNGEDNIHSKLNFINQYQNREK
ncbi:MAG: DUF4380 domain-containing protein [Bacteroidota bacterium]